MKAVGFGNREQGLSGVYRGNTSQFQKKTKKKNRLTSKSHTADKQSVRAKAAVASTDALKQSSWNQFRKTEPKLMELH